MNNCFHHFIVRYSIKNICNISIFNFKQITNTILGVIHLPKVSRI